MNRKTTYEELEQKVKRLEKERIAELFEANKQLQQQIKEHKKTEKALQKSQEQYQTLIDTMPHGIQEIDPSGIITFSNLSHNKIFGYEDEDMSGTSILDLQVSQSARESLSAYLKTLVKEQPKPTPYIVKNKTKEGKIIWIQVDWNYKRDKQNRVTGFISIITDITERKQSDEKLQTTIEKLHELESIINRSPAMVFLWPIQEGWPVEFVSDNVEQILGYSADDFMLGKISWPGITHPEDIPRLEAEVGKYLEEGTTEFDQEYRLITKSGDVRWMRDQNKVLANSNDTTTHIQSIAIDVTERKRAEESLQRSYQELELRETVAKMFLTTPKDRLFSDILVLLLNTFNSEGGYFGYIDEAGDLLCPSMTQDVWTQCSIPEKSCIFPKNRWGGIWGESLSKKRSLLQNENLNLPEGHTPLHNALVVPLLIGDKLVGQIAIANKPINYTIDDQKQLESLCNFIAPILQIYIEREYAQEKLRSHAKKLEEKNIALKVLLENRDMEKKKLADSVMTNFERLVLPYYEKLKASHKHDDILTILDIIETNTQESLTPLEKSAPSVYRTFTPMEIQVADLIKAGKSSKQISTVLKISLRSVFFHRENIRKKLNIHKTRTNLRTHLLSLP